MESSIVRALALAVAVELVLSVGVVVARGYEGPAADRLSLAPLERPPATVPPDPTGTGGSQGLDPCEAERQPRVTFSGTARSVATTGRLEGISRLRASGGYLSVNGRVTGADGADLGEGAVEASGGSVLVEGQGMRVGLDIASGNAGMLVEPGQVRAVDERFDRLRLEVGPEVRLSASALSFRPTSPTSPTSASTVAVRVRGPVVVATRSPGRVSLSGGGVRLTEMTGPVVLREADSGYGGYREATRFSWAGDGRVDVPGAGAVQGQTLGVSARTLAATLRDEGGRITVSGDASVDQVWVDRRAHLATCASVAVRGAPPGPLPAGARTWVRWAPRNDGSFDMAVTRIRPATAAARWVNLAMVPLPSMDGRGGPGAGGDTRGFGDEGNNTRSAIPVASLLASGEEDDRSLSIDIPPGTPAGSYELELVLEGNFAPARASVTVVVRGPGPAGTVRSS